jgi:hypothetical protein
MRSLLQPHFSPGRMNAFRHRVETLATELLSDLAQQARPADLNAALALPLPSGTGRATASARPSPASSCRLPSPSSLRASRRCGSPYRSRTWPSATLIPTEPTRRARRPLQRVREMLPGAERVHHPERPHARQRRRDVLDLIVGSSPGSPLASHATPVLRACSCTPGVPGRSRHRRRWAGISP